MTLADIGALRLQLRRAQLRLRQKKSPVNSRLLGVAELGIEPGSLALSCGLRVAPPTARGDPSWAGVRKHKATVFPFLLYINPSYFFFCRGPFALPGVASYARFLLRGMRLKMYFFKCNPARGEGPKFSKGSAAPHKIASTP